MDSPFSAAPGAPPPGAPPTAGPQAAPSPAAPQASSTAGSQGGAPSPGDPQARRSVPDLLLVDDALFDEHRARGYHPERPERLHAARRAVDSCAAAGVTLGRLTARDATPDELARAHAHAYLDALNRARGHHASIDPDTYVAPRSIEAAVRAAGSAIALTEALLDTPAPAAPGPPEPRARAGFALLRPPGHHATRDTGMGFCLLNNIAIAAHAALSRGLERVAVVDFDVHHGNGTQDIFWRDPRVLFISLHQWPFYPGSGAPREAGEGDGAGYNVNIALTDGATDAVYDAAFDEIVLPILDEYAPELVLVSAGYDAHERDPLASMKLTEAGYASMTTKLVAAASRSAGGRLGMVLEGGYDLAAIEASVAATLLTASGRRDLAPPPASGRAAGGSAIGPRHRADLDRARHQALRRWSSL